MGISPILNCVCCMTVLPIFILKEGRKCFFIYGYMASDMVKDHSDSKRGNLYFATIWATLSD